MRDIGGQDVQAMDRLYSIALSFKFSLDRESGRLPSPQLRKHLEKTKSNPSGSVPPSALPEQQDTHVLVTKSTDTLSVPCRFVNGSLMKLLRCRLIRVSGGNVGPKAGIGAVCGQDPWGSEGKIPHKLGWV